MPRSCSICSHTLGAEFDAVLASGVPVGTALDDARFSATGWSLSTAYRHRQRHLSQTLLRERRASMELGTGDLITRLVEVLDDVAAVRGSALATGSTGLLLRSASQTLTAVNSLADRLGIDAEEVARELREAEHVARAWSLTIRDHPESGNWLADQFDHIEGAEDLATESRNLAVRAALRLEGIQK